MKLQHLKSRKLTKRQRKAARGPNAMSSAIIQRGNKSRRGNRVYAGTSTWKYAPGTLVFVGYA